MVQRVLLVVGDGVGEGPAGGGRRLEALIAPAAVEIELVDGRAADEGRAVRRHVLDAAPGAQQPQPRDERHQRHRAFGDRLHLRQHAALGIGVEAVDMAAEHEAALVRLREVEQLRTERDDVMDDGLQRLGHEGLQHVALDGKPQARHRRDMRGVPGDRDRDLAGVDPARATSRCRRPCCRLADDARHLAMLEDVDAAAGRRRARSPRRPHRAARCRRDAGCSPPQIGKRASFEKSR